MAVILYGPSLALSQITGLNMWISVGACGIICTIYTSIVCICLCNILKLATSISLGWYENCDLDRSTTGYNHVSWPIFIYHIRYGKSQRLRNTKVITALHLCIGFIDAGGMQSVLKKVSEGNRFQFSV